MKYCVISKQVLMIDSNGSVTEWIPGNNGEPVEMTNTGTVAKYVKIRDRVTWHDGFPMFSNVEKVTDHGEDIMRALEVGVDWKVLHKCIREGDFIKLQIMRAYLKGGGDGSPLPK